MSRRRNNSDYYARGEDSRSQGSSGNGGGYMNTGYQANGRRWYGYQEQQQQQQQQQYNNGNHRYRSTANGPPWVNNYGNFAMSYPPQNIQDNRTTRSSRGGGFNNANTNRRNTYHRREDGNRQQYRQPLSHTQYSTSRKRNAGPVDSLESVDGTSNEDPNYLPGFTYNPATGKHYAIAGLSLEEILEMAKKERKAIEAEEQRRIEKSIEVVERKPSTKSIHQLLNGLSIGGRKAPQFHQVVRTLESERLRHVKSTANCVQENPLCDSSMTVLGCNFLEVSPDGEKMVGCFVMGSHMLRVPGVSAIVGLRARIDDRVARENAILADRAEDQQVYNTMGLVFDPIYQQNHQDNDFEILINEGESLVDMSLAKMDSDVTCVLYTTTRASFNGTRPIAHSRMVMSPLSALCANDSDVREFLAAPVYNILQDYNELATSCAFNYSKQKVAIGMEGRALIRDILGEKEFAISSQHKNVMSQTFDKRGNHIYMGLKNHNVIISDLRMKEKHQTGFLAGSKSAPCIKVLESTPYESVLTQSMSGDGKAELKLWDVRRTDKELMVFKGHRKTHFRLPFCVDPEGKFVFAVGDDSHTRGWSLQTGELLCKLSPSKEPVDQLEYPRVAYSSSWGGRAGNAALVLAAGSDIRIHQLDL